MSHFFTKNREAVQPRWQKRHTATNSRNDTFTIYAQVMQPGQPLHRNQGLVYQHPGIQSEISKLRDTLKTLQHLNSEEDHQSGLDFQNKGLSVGNSRNVKVRHLHIQQLEDDIDFHKQPKIKSYLLGSQSSRHNESIPTSQSCDYMSKLDLMKQRLQQICLKQQQITPSSYSGIRSPQSESINGRSKNVSAADRKNNSRQPTSRNIPKYNKQANKRDEEQGYTILRQQNQGLGIKNTAPIPTIIHQQPDYEDYKRSSTLHLSSHCQPNKGNVKCSPHDRPKANAYKFEQGNKMSNYEMVLSQKKKPYNQSSNRLQLYPSFSQEIDMKVYRDSSAAKLTEIQGRTKNRTRDKSQNRYEKMREELQILEKMRSSSFVQTKPKNAISSKSGSSEQQTKRKTSNQGVQTINKTQVNAKAKASSVENKNAQNKLEVLKLHRASINQMIFWQSSGELSCTHMVTGSGDYSVCFHELHHEQGELISSELYRHRAAVTSMMKINNILLSTGKDLYLKYYNLSTDVPPQIINSSIYAFEDIPTQLACVDETRVVVASVNNIKLFDLNKCQIIQETAIPSNARLIENRTNLFVGSSSSLSMLDWSLPDVHVMISQNLPYVHNWIVNPHENLFLTNFDGNIFRLEFGQAGRSSKEPALIANISLSHDLTDFCWYSSPQSSNIILTTLTMENSQSHQTRNWLTEHNINNAISTQVNLTSAGPIISSRASCFNIVREFQGKYYIGDKSGNLHLKGRVFSSQPYRKA